MTYLSKGRPKFYSTQFLFLSYGKTIFLYDERQSIFETIDIDDGDIIH